LDKSIFHVPSISGVGSVAGAYVVPDVEMFEPATRFEHETFEAAVENFRQHVSAGKHFEKIVLRGVEYATGDEVPLSFLGDNPNALKRKLSTLEPPGAGSTGAVVEQPGTSFEIAVRCCVPCDDMDRFNITAVSFMTDATNSSVFKKSKVQSAMFEIRRLNCFEEPCTPRSEFWFRDAFEKHKVMADLQAVTDGSGAGGLALLEKQFRSVGLPTFRDLVKLFEAGKSGPREIHLYADCTDGGPNELKRKKFIAVYTHQIVSVLYFPTRCFKHEGHLGVRQGLRVTDEYLEDISAPFKYFSAIAKLINCWREDLRSVYDAASLEFGAAWAQRVCGSVPPRCLSGRWGSITNSERFLIEFGDNSRTRRDALMRVMIRAFAKKSDSDTGVALKSDAPDREIALEDTEAYRQKYGK
jgi:hypothetical protein